MEKFVIAKDFVKKIKRFNIVGRTVEFKLKPVPLGEEPVSWIKHGINQVLEKGTEGLQPGDQVSFSFCSKEFNRGEGWIRFRPVEDVTYENVWDVISSVYQSNSTALNTETFCLGVTSVRMPAGKGKGRYYNTFNEECAMRKGIVAINNKDSMCLPRALIVAIAKVTKDKDYQKIRRDIGKLQTTKAFQLCADAGVVIPEQGAGISELEKFQNHLQNYKITVYRYGSKGRDIIFQGGEGPSLNLLYHKGHFNVIVSLTAAFCSNYFCEDCHIPFDHKYKHMCVKRCLCCQQSPACPPTPKIICINCHRWFKGQLCFDNHMEHGICDQISSCRDCFKIIKNGGKHICGEIFCKICRTYCPQGHLCFMQPDKGSPKTKGILFVFYDLETRQEKLMEDGSLVHESNLCVFKQCCETCMNTDILICNICGVRLQVLKCEDPISPFLHHLLTLKKKFKQVVVIAHNGQAFDHQFILNHIITKTDLTPNLIMRGTKIILMETENVKFLDSLNYFPMALAKLPKAFGLSDTFKKGYFPHLFNTSSNANYVGLLPAIEFYSPDNMKSDDREKFLTWYSNHKNDTFNMQRDIVDYCVSDVEILTQASLKFRDQMLTTANVCPFTEACTIASTCNKVYRRNFLKPNTIGLIPKNGYRWRDNQSKIAVQWLVWEQNQRATNIIHAAKQQEVIVHGVKVDGYSSDTKQIFEFHGCYYHGCPTCFKSNRDEALHGNPTETMNLRYESTLAKTERLKEFGYEVIEKWECHFRREIEEKCQIREYTENHSLLSQVPLDPRDAFYGGRTGNIFEYYKIQANEKIKYVDVCSLYPWVCKYGKFPIGHPQVFVGSACKNFDLLTTEGLIKCKILPPQVLFHPVLPVKMNNKLMFVLCNACGEEMNQEQCKHTENERALTGTWVIDEVRKATEKGYSILETYELWKYEIEQYDSVKNKAGIFSEMMNKFIQIKQQASGWPKNYNTTEERYKYVEQFAEKEEVMMDFAEILENSGLRSLAKLILNSFWGKFGQRENQQKTKIIRDPAEFFSLMTDSSLYINSVFPINEETLVVAYEHREETYDPLTTVNVAIAAYVTAQARLKLYSYLEQLEERVLYYDTDSVIYISRPEELDVPTGEFIGDLTDELECFGVGSYITEFVSGGPKNYAYKVFSTRDEKENVVCKVKGICLNYAACKLVNFDSIKGMILTHSEPLNIISKNIRRTKEHEVTTVIETKQYKPNSTKRKFCDKVSVPYGYKKSKFN